ncbi:hypothetical protein Dda_2462 [Drechslerella dactyloides]|uniref:Uncharacterized protein n=1 Tax=Drechslerella dactyloides TaxID=74499 RepID=A0AAD6J123_DREDA|nr:hypothetical protein Dda_2462 [Drechslerella dactyloides]
MNSEGDDTSSNSAGNSEAESTQADDDELALGLKQFYTDVDRNGCRPLLLGQLITTQSRTNASIDQDPAIFGSVVWQRIKKDDPGLAGKILEWVKDYFRKKNIAGAIYDTVRKIFREDPYLVPCASLDSFAGMRMPEVVEWLIRNLG